MPWLNGGGITQEIASKSDDRGLLWRVSTARVEADCYYSLFPGLRRLSAVVEGNGVRLTCTKTNEVSLIDQSQIAALSGDVLYRGVLIDGGFRHLNLVFHPARVSSEVAFLQNENTSLSRDASHLIYCCHGEIFGTDDIRANDGEALIVDGSDEVRLQAGSRAIRISVRTTNTQ